MRRLPPHNVEENLTGLIDLVRYKFTNSSNIHPNGILPCQVPTLCEDLLASIDQPLKVAKDTESKRDYLLCDYNRDGDSYR